MLTDSGQKRTRGPSHVREGAPSNGVRSGGWSYFLPSRVRFPSCSGAVSGRIVGGTETPFLAFPFEVTARPKRDVQVNQQWGVSPVERQAFTVLVGTQVRTGIAAKAPVVDQRMGPG